jgi:hypothetical protein
MITRRITGTALAAAAIVLVAGLTSLPEAQSQSTRVAPASVRPAPPTPEQCEAVLRELRALGADVSALDLALDERISWMNAAPDAQRFDALETVLEDLIVQRCQVRELMKRTHQKLFLHLFEHLLIDDAEARRASIMGCPVVAQMREEQRGSEAVPLPEEMIR